MLSCENVDEAEAYLSDKWSEMIACSASQEKGVSAFFEELKAIVRRRIDFDQKQVETMIKNLP